MYAPGTAGVGAEGVGGGRAAGGGDTSSGRCHRGEDQRLAQNGIAERHRLGVPRLVMAHVFDYTGVNWDSPIREAA